MAARSSSGIVSMAPRVVTVDRQTVTMEFSGQTNLLTL
jgi:hypothetical protein